MNSKLVFKSFTSIRPSLFSTSIKKAPLSRREAELIGRTRISPPTRTVWAKQWTQLNRIGLSSEMSKLLKVTDAPGTTKPMKLVTWRLLLVVSTVRSMRGTLHLPGTGSSIWARNRGMLSVNPSKLRKTQELSQWRNLQKKQNKNYVFLNLEHFLVQSICFIQRKIICLNVLNQRVKKLKSLLKSQGKRLQLQNWNKNKMKINLKSRSIVQQ